MPMYDVKLTVGGIFYFDETLEIGSFEWTQNHPNFVVGNPWPYSSMNEKEEVLVCQSIREVLLAFQLGFMNPIMVVDMENFPHRVFEAFKRVSLLHLDLKMIEYIARDWTACYHLDHELCPEDTMEKLMLNKRWGNRGALPMNFYNNPFVFADKLWWNTFSPISKTRALINSAGEVYEPRIKMNKKNAYLEVATEFGTISVDTYGVLFSPGDQRVEIPTTEDVHAQLVETLKNTLPFMREDYAKVLSWWLMYLYVYPLFPFPSQNINLVFENNSFKNNAANILNFIVPNEKGFLTDYSTASISLVKLRSDVPLE
jgi:hypothetical protein